MRRLVLLGSVVLVGCATLPRVTLAPAPVADQPALRAAAEAFYSAQAPAQLREAVAAAAAAGPRSAIACELASRLALLEGRDDDALASLVEALRDTRDDAPLLHLHFLSWLDYSRAQRPLVGALLRELAASHPSAEVRAAAAYQLTGLLHAQGDLEGRDAAVASLGGRLDFAVVGTWDNDQGKGYDLELAPEVRPGLEQRYDGRSGPLRWRPHARTDGRGRLDLAALMTPTRWAVAFAQAEVTLPTSGAYTLAVTTADPLKLWVDGELVFAAPQVDRMAFDGLTVPLTLSAGSHRVLVKSAHRQGAWYLLARILPGGPAAEPQPPRAAVAGVDGAIERQLAGLDPGDPPAEPTLGRLGGRTAERAPRLEGARAWAHRVAWGHFLAGGATTVKLADAWVKRAPKSVVARLWQADALWYNQERGRTADLLAALDAELGEALPFVRLRQARFHQQQGLKQKAREKLEQVRKAHPRSREAWDLLVELNRSEGWIQDELAAEREGMATLGATPGDLTEHARTLLRDGRRAEAVAVYQALLDWLPLHAEALDQLAELRRDAGDLRGAQELLEKRLASWPTDGSAWLDLAEVRRRLGHRDEARSALAEAARLAPDAAAPEVRRGELAYEAGDVPAALAAWRHALELNPEDEALANRIEHLAPEARGPWAADVPDEVALERIVTLRERVKQLPGADVVWLLDHEVTLLNTDGSTTNAMTVVLHAFNAQGRDRIIRQTVPAGRLRVLHAWSVDEKGLRSEASSERNRQIFFRGMQPGSTLVLQFRLDVPPTGYLSRYLTQSWSFQSVADQRVESTYVLWAPLGTTLHEQRVGAVERSQERRGDQLRLVWTAKDVPPLLAEPNMPPLSELAANLRLSTVPDWKTWLSWEQALLEGVFRDSPELDALAKRLGEGAAGGDETLQRIQAYVMEEIRYQQDYESFIAGVKPHPAPVVLERRYGDCKDKAVLFIELARKLGLDAHFALVRTRDLGPASAEVPMQQFNHAVVYVPPQAGVAAPRFFDPTAELLDLDAVRADDVGTQSLVFEPATGAHAWREIPLQPPATHREASTVKLTLAADGSAKGTFRIEGQGRAGALLRRFARNQESLAQGLQRLTNQLVPGSSSSSPRVEQAASLAEPAALSADLAVSALAHPEGDTLRLKLPAGWNPHEGAFSLATRRHPLLLGVPSLVETRVELELPEGWEVRRPGLGGAVELPCLALSRQVTLAGRKATAVTTLTWRCERISAAEYPAYRAKVDELSRLLDDELVVAPRPAKAVRPPGQKR